MKLLVVWFISSVAMSWLVRLMSTSCEFKRLSSLLRFSLIRKSSLFKVIFELLAWFGFFNSSHFSWRNESTSLRVCSPLGTELKIWSKYWRSSSFKLSKMAYAYSSTILRLIIFKSTLGDYLFTAPPSFFDKIRLGFLPLLALLSIFSDSKFTGLSGSLSTLGIFTRHSSYGYNSYLTTFYIPLII